MAAFLAKKVPKIFPSSKKKTNETTALSSTRTKKERVTASLFRRLSGDHGKTAASTPKQSTTKDSNVEVGTSNLGSTRTPTSAMDIDRAMEPTKEPQQEGDALASCDCANQHDQQQQHPHPHETKAKHYNAHCHGDVCCSSNSDASTLESSPTSTPRDTMDPALLAFPDLPKLAFPSSPRKHQGDDTPGMPMATTTAAAATTSIPPSLRLVPRRAAPSTPHETEWHPHPQPPQQQQQDGEISFDCHDEDKDERDGFLPPPLTRIPMEFVLPPPSPVAKTRGCLWGPPPRAGEWDDATIESQPLEDPDGHEHEHNATRITSTAAPATSSQDAASAMASQQQREKAAAQASALMKPWIERAARLALLQNRACGNHNHINILSSDNLPEDSRRTVGPASEGTTHEATEAAAETKPMPPRDAEDARVAPLLLRRTRQHQREAALQQCGLRPRLESNLLYHNRALLASLEEQRRRRRDATVNANANINANLRPKNSSASSSSSSSLSCAQEKPREPRLAPRIVKWHVVRHPSQG